MFISQAILSIGLCLYLFYTAMRDPIDNLLPQSSDISLEFVVIVLFVVLQMLSQSPVFRKENYYWRIHEECEKELYAFERNFGCLLPDRARQDVALRIIVYTIALTENHYRPKSHRRIERLLAKIGLQRFGIAKTTGLMQVTSDTILSDEESVRLAIPIIEEIYDRYLVTSNRFALKLQPYNNQDISNLLMLYRSGYAYDLMFMIEAIGHDINAIYGKYSGSNLSNPRLFYECARDFVLHKEYEQGYGSVEVDYPIDAFFGDIPADPWCRIERNQGFATSINLPTAKVYHSSSQIVLLDIIEDAKRSQMESKVLLLVNKHGKTTLILRDSVSDKEFEGLLKEKYGLDFCGERPFSFDQFRSNPNTFLDEIAVQLPSAKG